LSHRTQFRRGGETGPDASGIRAAIFDSLDTSRQLLTAATLERRVSSDTGYPRDTVRGAIRWLIMEGVLEYQYTFGQSYLIRSFRKPVSVGARFVILPPDYSTAALPDCLPIAIAPGAAFGCGRHPTTRLALEALEQGWAFISRIAPNPPAVLDVGTGSGILAIGAAALGAQQVLALDIDACARSEARKNIALNRMADRVSVSGEDLTTLETFFGVVIANLRLPTLVQLSDWICAHLTSPGCLVVSGYREGEWDRLHEVYTEKGLAVCWHETTAGWSGGVFVSAPR
jgi:ribosomal protein L11 methyltransferase